MVVTWYVVNVEITISAREHQSGLPGEGGDGYDVGEAHRGDSDGGPGAGLVESVRHLGEQCRGQVRSGQVRGQTGRTYLCRKVAGTSSDCFT